MPPCVYIIHAILILHINPEYNVVNCPSRITLLISGLHRPGNASSAGSAGSGTPDSPRAFRQRAGPLRMFQGRARVSRFRKRFLPRAQNGFKQEFFCSLQPGSALPSVLQNMGMIKHHLVCTDVNTPQTGFSIPPKKQ